MRRTLRDLHEMYQRGEYITEFNDTKYQYLKVLDAVPQKTRDELMRLDEKIARRHQISVLLACLAYFVLGIIVGVALCMP